MGEVGEDLNGHEQEMSSQGKTKEDMRRKDSSSPHVQESPLRDSPFGK